MAPHREPTIEAAAVQDLRAAMHGTLLTPDQEGYAVARRIWNGMIDKHPALIARCADAADVARVVEFARGRELLVAVRGGGHSFPGYSTCNGGLMIDLSAMRSVSISPDRRTAHVDGGAWVVHVDSVAQKQDLATTLGEISNRARLRRSHSDLQTAAHAYDLAGHVGCAGTQVRDDLGVIHRLAHPCQRHRIAGGGILPHDGNRLVHLGSASLIEARELLGEK